MSDHSDEYLQKQNESTQEYYERILKKEEEEEEEQERKEKEAKQRKPGELEKDYLRRCCNYVDPFGKQVCHFKFRGCQGKEAVWTYDPFAFEIYNEYVWGWVCGKCLDELLLST